MDHDHRFPARLGALALLLAGCADRMATPETPMQPAAGRSTERMFSEPRIASEPDPAAPSVGIASIGIAKTNAGQPYLVDSAGRSLYLFLADEGSVGSKCYDACATAWPPVITSGAPKSLTMDIDTIKLGTIARKDGTLQVTYAGWPLYYYARDRAPGETLGQDLMDFGAEWYLVSPAGDRVEGQQMQSPASGEPARTTAPPTQPEEVPQPSTSPGGIY